MASGNFWRHHYFEFVVLDNGHWILCEGHHSPLHITSKKSWGVLPVVTIFKTANKCKKGFLMNINKAEDKM